MGRQRIKAAIPKAKKLMTNMSALREYHGDRFINWKRFMLILPLFSPPLGRGEPETHYARQVATVVLKGQARC
jgi:hypothetical protein